MDGYRERRIALLQSAEPGLSSARQLCGITDEAVSAVAEAASSSLRSDWALVALGGYGCGRLLPTSDLDLLVLTEHAGPTLTEAVREILYPLWDAGLTVGHQVRSRRDHLRACREDLKTLTASLTGRVIAGDAGYGDGALAEVARHARRRSARVLAELSERDRPGSPYLLEPDLKEGAGGQRDLDEIVWRAAIALGEVAHSPRAAARAGLLDAEAADALAGAGERVAAARWELGLRAPASSRMTLVAASEMREDPQAVQDALARISDALEGVREEAGATAGGVRARGRRTRRATAAASGPPAPDAARAAQWDAAALFAAAGAGDARAIERAAYRGELAELAAPLRELMRVRRPGLSHALTVGAHCVACACAVEALAATEPSLAASVADAEDLRPVVVAALVHDAGKLQPGPGHAERGVGAAAQAALAFGLSPAEGALVERLVRDHLLLPEAALRTDPDDPAAITPIAERVGDVRLLGALHLLSAADSAATGDAAWSPWHATLLATLVSSVRSVIAGEVRTAERCRMEAAERLTQDAADASALDWLRAAPARFFGARSPEEAVADARLAAAAGRQRAGAAPLLRVSASATEGLWTITAAGADRDRLYSQLAGVLALAGLDVLSSSAIGAAGVVLDTFTVRSATLAPVRHESWTEVERLLGAAARGHLSIDTRLAQRRTHYRSSTPAGGGSPSVRFDASDPSSILVHVEATDRVGLLYELASALADFDLAITWANAVVQDGVARDVFRVVSTEDRERLPGVLGHASMRIRERLAP